MTPITQTMVKKAYLALKNYAFRESFNLFLKSSLAQFEKNLVSQGVNTDYSRLEEFFHNFAGQISKSDYYYSEAFTRLLNQIHIRVIPKKFSLEPFQEFSEPPNELKFFTNNKQANQYYVKKFSYIIEAPIELHLIDILWSMTIGGVFDASLSEDCYGNRLDKGFTKYEESGSYINNNFSPNIFEYFYTQYNKWRDKAFSYATEISKHGHNVAILSLDIQAFYPSLDIDFEEVKNLAVTANAPYSYLTDYLSEILKSYNIILKNKGFKQNDFEIGLPIGFISSAILANYALKDLDNFITKKIRPNYYGRYVDDVLLVLQNPTISTINVVEAFINEYFDEIISLNSNDYQIKLKSRINRKTLTIQKDKVVLLYFDKSGSKAGLELLKEELDSKTSVVSDFYTDYLDKDLEYFAYQYLYDGHKDTVRNIIGLNENDAEFEHFLRTHISANKLCKFDNSDTIYSKILEFFTGINSVKFYKLWGKVYEYLFTNGKYSEAKRFYDRINIELEKISCESASYQPIIISGLTEYNLISYMLVKALTLNMPFGISLPIIDDLEIMDFGESLSLAFRISNIFNHDLVGWSLINFSNYTGNLLRQTEIMKVAKLEITQDRIEFSPRFITFDEFQLFTLLQFLTNNTTTNIEDSSETKIIFSDPNLDFNKWFESSIDDYFHRDLIKGNISSQLDDKNEAVQSNLIKVGKNENKDKLSIGIANFIVSGDDILNNIRGDKKTNISTNRFKILLNILTDAKNQGCDILVLPEASIPVVWLPFMTEYSRKYQMGIIFGLEHWTRDGIAYNFLVEILPFRKSKKYKYTAFTIRLKNHYAPSEKSILSDFRLKNPSENRHLSYYHRVKWRGVSFTTYNCFELADITHRSIYKNKIDLLIACVHNKDTNYYNHIMESVVRDLHCYTVQVNTAEYGGSCVLRPSKTERKTLMYVKGGENECVLKTTLDIKNLRDFQFSKTGGNTFNPQDLKFVPPGFDNLSPNLR